MNLACSVNFKKKLKLPIEACRLGSSIIGANPKNLLETTLRRESRG